MPAVCAAASACRPDPAGAPGPGVGASGIDAGEVGPRRLTTLTARADFLRAATGRRAHVPGFVLQARCRAPHEADRDSIRIGITCSKKVGNAVARNRAKRRLREVARLDLPRLGRPGWDYVVIGRRGVTGARPWPLLRADLAEALAKVAP